MFRKLIRTNVFWLLLPLALFATSEVNAETVSFSYVYIGTDGNPWSAGATLTGQIEGTVDSTNPDRVIINGFNSVVLSRPGLPPFIYDTITASEFNTFPVGGVPVMSFSGMLNNFLSCPEGFDPNFPGDCSFSDWPGGGFVITPLADGRLFITAADGSGDTEMCHGSSDQRGCRVLDFPFAFANWSLVVLPDSADVDPSAVIGSGSEIKKDVVVKEGVVLGENVTANKDTSIGANSTIGNNVFIGKDVVIEDGVNVGNDTTINKGVHICSGAIVGSAVTIGKNNLILNGPGVDVPDGIVLNGRAKLSGECL